MWDDIVSWIRSVAELIGYLTVIGGAAYAVFRRLRPPPPDVLVHGPGASLNHEIDPTTGKKRWAMVEPSWRIENAGDKNIYNVTTGLRTLDGEIDLPHPSMKIHLIQPGVSQNVSNLRLTQELLDIVAYDPHPHLSLIYWARFKDSSGRSWEVRHEPPDAMPVVTRLYRWHWRRCRRLF